MSDQVYPITPGQALNVTLNNYYDVLKNQIGGLQANERLQLKLVADPVDISKTYPWFSQYNLLNRCDVQIAPVPVSADVFLNAGKLVDVYANFISKLTKYVVIPSLTQQQLDQLAALRGVGQTLAVSISASLKAQKSDWIDYCAATGTSPGDIYAFTTWKSTFDNNQQTIDSLVQQLTTNNFQINQILKAQIPDAQDQAIILADKTFRDASMFLRYPVFSDDTYLPTVINLSYLTNLPAAPSAQFDNRRAITWNMSIPTITDGGAGQFLISFDKTTGSSNSISTDWSGSGSVDYFFFSVNASASEHTQIQEDFDTTTKVTICAKAAFRANIVYPSWFNTTLFSCKHVLDNLSDFSEFFGPNGSLMYYPIGIILVRGFSAQFENSQNWAYDYDHSFSASAGGGLSFCGINFGGSQSYGSHQHEHKIDKVATKLTISDDDATIRFVGYALYLNDVCSKYKSPVTEPGPMAKALL